MFDLQVVFRFHCFPGLTFRYYKARNEEDGKNFEKFDLFFTKYKYRYKYKIR